MAFTQNAPMKILVVTFPENDMLDIVGPMESLARASDYDHLIKVTVTGVSRCPSSQFISMACDIDYQSALDTVSDYDLLLIPGGPPNVIEALLHPDNMAVKIIQKFSQLKRSAAQTDRPRVILSICTGSIFLAHLGLFKNGWKCTTHYAYEGPFQALLDKHCPGAQYVQASYVDSGYLDSGVNVIDAGGITNGIDAGLYVVSKYFDNPTSTSHYDLASSSMDYRNRVRHGVPPLH